VLPVRYELNVYIYIYIYIYIYYVEESRPPLYSSGQSFWLQNTFIVFSVRYELNLYMLCRRKEKLLQLFDASDFEISAP
jgi:hypothetical protein